jgi:hypothetical protein
MRKNIIVTVFCFILTAGYIHAAGDRETVPANERVSSSPQQNQTRTVRGEITRAEQVMRALAQAYPRQIDRVEFRNNDWAVLLRGTWYFYAGGRLLPQNLLSSAESFSPHPFYNNYPAELPPWRSPTPEEAERFRSMTNNRSQNPLQRSPHFFDALWRANNRNEAYDRVKTIRFLGNPVTVHFMIMENLALVEEHILAAARVDSRVQAWINNISNLEGWSWRNIAETQSRSFHSYGLAVDIMPRSFGGRETYWLWTIRHRPDWWNVSYNERFHPPAAVISAFEKFGFIWGGKWLYYDTIHFEFRPEVLFLNNMPPETRR